MTILLCMIVKNEAAVIERCLRSVAGLVSDYVIHDTGSTDGTQRIIRDVMADLGIGGVVYDVPWVNFAENRTSVMRQARREKGLPGTHTLVIDADDTLVVSDQKALLDTLRTTNCDAYMVDVVLGNISYRRPQIFANNRHWGYRGVIHEFADCMDDKGGVTYGHLPGLTMVCGNDGARRCDPDKYAKDAQALEQALRDEKDPMMVSRYTFYLAQSHRDAGENVKAARYYAERINMGFWAEEVYVSYLNLVRILSCQPGATPGLIWDMHLKARDVCPQRAEVACAAARYLRLQEDYSRAYQAALSVSMLPQPEDGLFVEADTYTHELLDELAVSAYYCGQYRVSLGSCLDILKEGRVPSHGRNRVLDNAGAAFRELVSETKP